MKEEYTSLFRPYFDGVAVPEISGARPLVSIFTPYYNNVDNSENAEYLRDAVDSVMEQSYAEWELFVVDDASPYCRAEDVLPAYDDARIKLIQMPKNAGLAGARNAAFALSSGEYILCLDHDDVMHPHCLRFMLAEALSPGFPDIVLMNHRDFGAISFLTECNIFSEKELTVRNWLPSFSLVKRALWSIAGGQSSAEEIRYGSPDWEFWLHAFEINSNLKLARSPLPLVLYRRRSGSMSVVSNFYEYRIRRRIVAERAAIFARWGTAEHFLAKGYAMSFHSHVVAGHWKTAWEIVREGWRVIEFTAFSHHMWDAFKKTFRVLYRLAGRKYVLEPLGLRHRKTN